MCSRPLQSTLSDNGVALSILVAFFPTLSPSAMKGYWYPSFIPGSISISSSFSSFSYLLFSLLWRQTSQTNTVNGASWQCSFAPHAKHMLSNIQVSNKNLLLEQVEAINDCLGLQSTYLTLGQSSHTSCCTICKTENIPHHWKNGLKNYQPTNLKSTRSQRLCPHFHSTVTLSRAWSLFGNRSVAGHSYGLSDIKILQAHLTGIGDSVIVQKSKLWRRQLTWRSVVIVPPLGISRWPPPPPMLKLKKPPPKNELEQRGIVSERERERER